MASSTRPKNPKPGETYTGPKGVTWRWNAKQNKWVRQKPAQSWEETVREKYAAFSYLLDNPEVMGQEITDILRRSVTEKWYKNPDNGYAKLNAAIRATNYFKTTTDNARAFDQQSPADQQARVEETAVLVRNLLGTQSINPTDLQRISRSAARLGLQGQVLNNYVFTQALVRDTEGQYRLGESAGIILAGGQATELRNRAKAYFTTVTDQDVEQYLTGQKTMVDFDNLFKNRAKGQMPHLAQQIDANLTLEDISADYRDVAAGLLEKDPNLVDMTDPKFMEAMSFTDQSGNTRQMTRAEWTTKLKTDARYGYQFTEQAVSQARRMARSIARGFGRQ